MKILILVFLFMAASGLIFSFAHAAGDPAKGKALFNEITFAAAASGKSCNSCHPDGKGLEKSGDKPEFKIMGKTQKNLEEAVNLCITNAIKGKAIDPKSDQMQDMVAFIKSLKDKMEKQAPGYK